MSKKSNEKDSPLTLAQQVFNGTIILTARPDGMPYEEYRAARCFQNKVIKKMFSKPNKHYHK